MSEVTVCGLLYGDFPDLATRMLRGLSEHLPWAQVKDVRLGCNAVSPAVLGLVEQLTKTFPVPVYAVVSQENLYKYPMMRLLLGQCERKINQPLGRRICWLDDDSYLTQSDTLPRLLGRMNSQSLVMVGKMYRYTGELKREQRSWIISQPWHTGRPIAAQPLFITGGFWVIDTPVLQRWSWPPVSIAHNGGDYMLGVLLDQQKLLFGNEDQGFAVNAGPDGRHSTATRRGETTPHLGTAAAAKLAVGKIERPVVICRFDHGRLEKVTEPNPWGLPIWREPQ